MEKHNIPEQNSLDLMEGPEPVADIVDQREGNLEKIKQVAFEKKRNILEYGTAHTSLFPTLRALVNNELFLNNRIGFFETKFKHDDKLDRETQFIEITPENVREYLNQSDFDTSLQDVLLYGIQSASRTGAQKIKSGDVVGSYNSGNTAKTAESYRKKMQESQDQQHNVYYNVIGRNTLKRYRLGIPDSWKAYEDDAEDHFESSWSRGGITMVFDAPDPSKEEDPNLETKMVQIGHYRLNSAMEIGIDKVWQKIKEKYPDIKPGDPRILEWFSLQKEYIGRLREQDRSKLDDLINSHPYSFFSDIFNEYGHTLATGQWGFKLRLRVAPRKIKGVVMNFGPKQAEQIPYSSVLLEDVKGDTNQMDDQELFNSFKKTVEYFKRDMSQWYTSHYDSILKRLVTIMEKIGQTDPEKVVPIYNYKGDMLWPQYILHDEIIEAENDKGARVASTRPS